MQQAVVQVRNAGGHNTKSKASVATENTCGTALVVAPSLMVADTPMHLPGFTLICGLFKCV
jgi:hypothetical protein